MPEVATGRRRPPECRLTGVATSRLEGYKWLREVVNAAAREAVGGWILMRARQ